MSDLLDLAARVEAAEGPDRELDRDIHCDVHGWEKRWSEQFEVFQCWKNDRWIGLGSIPAYTASLDAAMTLVPEGWRVAALGEQREHDDHGEYVGGWFVRLHYTAGPRTFNLKWGKGATPALALCAAALRARSAQS